MHRRTRLWGAFIVTPILLGAQCSVTGANGGLEAAPANFDEARQEWTAAGIDDYTFVLQRSCFCAGGVEPVRIVVRDGVAVSYTVVPTGRPLAAEYREWYPTIDGLFEVVEDALANADAVAVVYHTQRGFPVRIDIDWVERAIDDEIRYDVVAFQTD
jgi:hypothetical protein